MLATVLTALAATIASPAPQPAHGPLTATYRPTLGTYCVRSGWRAASLSTGRPIRAGECRNAAGWRRRGLEFDASRTAPTITI